MGYGFHAAPRIVDPAGEEIYGLKVVDLDALPDHTLAAFATSESEIESWERVGEHPLRLRAERLGDHSIELVVSTADAERLRHLDRRHDILRAGRVIFLTEPNTLTEPKTLKEYRP